LVRSSSSLSHSLSSGGRRRRRRRKRRVGAVQIDFKLLLVLLVS
jgi:hypothetical protein